MDPRTRFWILVMGVLISTDISFTYLVLNEVDEVPLEFEDDDCTQLKVFNEEECNRFIKDIEKKEVDLKETINQVFDLIHASKIRIGKQCKSKQKLPGNSIRCSNIPSPCFKGVECQDNNEGVVCGACPLGYIGNGKKCHKEISCKNKPCYDGVTCENRKEFPFFKCGNCPVGFKGDGSTCMDIDECEEVKPCYPQANCTNLSPGFKCSCPLGFTGIEQVYAVGLEEAKGIHHECLDIDECEDGNNGGCVQNSQCINTEGSFHCGSCNQGYKGNQRNGCKPIPGFCSDHRDCDVNANCISQGVSSHKICVCQTGWAGNGFICGFDSDLDSWPDDQLDCVEPHCIKDNCRTISNAGQEDHDKDDIGDLCDDDADNDGFLNVKDNCLLSYNRDQKDSDRDGMGDKCDNCPHLPNGGQEDIDNDGLGDLCDFDIDEDGIPNDFDNCKNKVNQDQLDEDNDGIGNACDNCPSVPNPDQKDNDLDSIGDACDNNLDTDKDGIQDNVDNCPNIANNNQLDTDNDGLGDECDDDIDGDNIPNVRDNCVLVSNPHQEDFNSNGIGNICEDDFDMDGMPNYMDNCPNNSQIYKTNFRSHQVVNLDPVGKIQQEPLWKLMNDGAEIVQILNSDPGLLVGQDKFNGVDFEGTFFVDTTHDNDYIGLVFSYQSNRNFYLAMWKKGNDGGADPGLQLRVVKSKTGPGKALYKSLWNTKTTPNEVKLLWLDSKKTEWKHKEAYRWKLIHRPNIGLIRIQVLNNKELIIDSKNIYDHTFKGGHLGVFCFSQEKVHWSDLHYKCNDDTIPAVVYKDLPRRLRDYLSVS